MEDILYVVLIVGAGVGVIWFLGALEKSWDESIARRARDWRQYVTAYQMMIDAEQQARDVGSPKYYSVRDFWDAAGNA